jgi:ubiquinone/menaquinone biosynthesis C-methylase UbiE
MKTNHRFILDYVSKSCPGGVILDYGCGGGEVVLSGRELGLNIVGVDSFYGGGDSKSFAVNNGLYGNYVFQLGSNFQIPLIDSSVDFVFSNMVLEHVDDLDATLLEISRVLKPNGQSLHLFPSSETIKEGHCGVPFVHWFRADSCIRRPYMKLMRSIGFGNFKSGKDIEKWADDFLLWIDNYCRYRTKYEILSSFSRTGFDVQFAEDEYIDFRLKLKGINIPSIKRIRLWKMFATVFCRRYGSMVIVAKKVSRASS